MLIWRLTESLKLPHDAHTSWFSGLRPHTRPAAVSTATLKRTPLSLPGTRAGGSGTRRARPTAERPEEDLARANWYRVNSWARPRAVHAPRLAM